MLAVFEQRPNAVTKPAVLAVALNRTELDSAEPTLARLADVTRTDPDDPLMIFEQTENESALQLWIPNKGGSCPPDETLVCI